eukprot:scaffold1954_cov268-Pinguiococcus_pyrenoidosus.AAC.312
MVARRGIFASGGAGWRGRKGMCHVEQRVSSARVVDGPTRNFSDVERASRAERCFPGVVTCREKLRDPGRSLVESGASSTNRAYTAQLVAAETASPVSRFPRCKALKTRLGMYLTSNIQRRLLRRFRRSSEPCAHEAMPYPN